MEIKFHHFSTNSIPIVKIKLYPSWIKHQKRKLYGIASFLLFYLLYFTVFLHQVLCKDLPQHLIFQG